MCAALDWLDLVQPDARHELAAQLRRQGAERVRPQLLDRRLEPPLVELRLLDWAHTIARRWLYEQADELPISALMQDDDARVAGLAAKINREEAYHRMHADMWRDRLSGDSRFQAALEELRPQLEVRGEHADEFEQLWEEMTSVRRSVAGATW